MPGSRERYCSKHNIKYYGSTCPQCREDEEKEEYREFVRLNCVGCKFASITTVESTVGSRVFYNRPCLHPKPDVLDQYHCLSRVLVEGKR